MLPRILCVEIEVIVVDVTQNPLCGDWGDSGWCYPESSVEIDMYPERYAYNMVRARWLNELGSWIT